MKPAPPVISTVAVMAGRYHKAAAGDRGAPLPWLVRKRGQGHELPLADQASTGKPSECEPHPLPQADGWSCRAGGAKKQVDEVPRVIDRRRRRGRGLERVERVALNERGVQSGERLDFADVVEHDEATPDRRQHADLAAAHFDRLHDGVELFASALEDVVHRTCAGVDAVATGGVGDLSPDLALNRTRLQTSSEARACLRVLHPAQPRVGRLGRRDKRLVVTPALPPASLNAADRHLQHGVGGHERRDVKRISRYLTGPKLRTRAGPEPDRDMNMATSAPAPPLARTRPDATACRIGRLRGRTSAGVLRLARTRCGAHSA